MEFKVVINKFGFTAYSVLLGFFLSFVLGLLINSYFPTLLENNFIIGIILIQIPLILMISYAIIVSFRHRQNLVLTDEGIQSTTFGQLSWTEIKECSYEFIRGVSFIYIKLENNKKYSIISSKKTRNPMEDVEEIYKAIIERRNKSNIKGLFVPKKHHISNIKNSLLLILVVLGLIIATIISFN